MLQLCGGGQDVVGVVGGVGLEMLEHHGEQVFARKTFDDLARIGCDRDGVAVVDDECFDFGTEFCRTWLLQVIANGHHVDRASASSFQIWPLQSSLVHREHARAGQQQASGRVLPCSYQSWQASNSTHRVATTTHALHAVVQANGGGRLVEVALAVVKCQGLDLLNGDTADLGRALWMPEQRTRFQRWPTERVFVNVIVIQPVVDDQLVHDTQRQRGIGAR